MLRLVCMNKIRDSHNRIKGYVLKDQYGRVRNVDADIVKEELTAGRIEIVNVKMDAAGRLINKSFQDMTMSKPNSNCEEVLKNIEHNLNNISWGIELYLVQTVKKDILELDMDMEEVVVNIKELNVQFEGVRDAVLNLYKTNKKFQMVLYDYLRYGDSLFKTFLKKTIKLQKEYYANMYMYSVWLKLDKSQIGKKLYGAIYDNRKEFIFTDPKNIKYVIGSLTDYTNETEDDVMDLLFTDVPGYD